MESHPDLTVSVIRGLGWFYLIVAVMNAFWTYRVFRSGAHYNSIAGFKDVPKAATWGLYTVVLAMLSFAHVIVDSTPADFLFRLPVGFKNLVDVVIANPISYFAVSMVIFVAMILLRRVWTRPTVAWVLLNIAMLFLGVSMTDYDFRQIVGKPDNVPIVGMLFLVGFFTWLYFYKSVENDRRIAAGEPKIEDEQSEQVLVWPDLVYTEMICMLLLTAFLIAWGIALQAPLEEPASAVKTPNPSKAPWYFLGLQEMLVYYDPWMAGVVLPSVILVGLMAIPYIDFNPKGNGYYTFEERKFSVITFLFGFLPLWVGMIVLGTFIRGPNWNMFGLYEYWDVHKLEVLNNVDLSQLFWVDWLGKPLPRPDANASALSQAGTIFLREWLGFALVLAYLFILPPLMAVTVFRSFFVKMGFLRFMVLANLILLMGALPLKMALRWAFTLKYIVSIPEWFFNI